jgi:hypothetical protein
MGGFFLFCFVFEVESHKLFFQASFEL